MRWNWKTLKPINTHIEQWNKIFHIMEEEGEIRNQKAAKRFSSTNLDNMMEAHFLYEFRASNDALKTLYDQLNFVTLSRNETHSKYLRHVV